MRMTILLQNETIHFNRLSPRETSMRSTRGPTDIIRPHPHQPIHNMAPHADDTVPIRRKDDQTVS